ncbi:MAG: lactate utilization protein [Planctomycetes bacterium]|nr:lactate utilization protein [Planctomycetota bacterium]
MTTSNEEILDAIRRNRPAPIELPSVTGEWTTYADCRQQFVEVLQAVGGQAIIARTREEADEQLRRLAIYSDAQKIASLVPGVGKPNVDLASIVSPHALEDVDIAILPGEFAVAENAAIWVTDRHVPLRVLFFLCQHLVLVVSADTIVDHMHAAYERIAAISNDNTPPFAEPMFGAFISGPSKTADIEQSLVIGAHGPRSLTVCLISEHST